MRPIDLIVIHCSATPNGDRLFRGKGGQAGFLTPVQVIDGWHKTRGFRRDPAARQRMNPNLLSIGYHFVVYTNGVTATGRHESEIGAHVVGNNRTSLGICMVGTDRFTAAQWKTLAGLVALLRKERPHARLCGHRDLSLDKNADGIVQPWEWLKTCPGFDVADWLINGEPKPENLYVEPQ